MKIYETQLNQNQYTAVKSIHIDSKPKYKGALFNQDRQNNMIDKSKFHIQKKVEKFEPTVIEQVAENSVKVNEYKSVSLEDLFKKFNTK